MKTAKLVIGIVSIVLFVFIAFQSCAAGMSNALEANGEMSGTAGLLLSGNGPPALRRRPAAPAAGYGNRTSRLA